MLVECIDFSFYSCQFLEIGRLDFKFKNYAAAMPGHSEDCSGCLTCELVGQDKRGGVPGPASDVVPGKAVTRYEASLPLSPS